VQLATERLILRELVDDDWRAIFEMESDPDVVRYLTKEAQSEDEASNYVQHMRFSAHEVPRMVFDFAITVRGDDRLIGRCGMRRSASEPREAMLWYVVAPAHQGRGYACEAARAVLGHAFDDLGLHRVYADADPRNPASIKVMEKLGMRREAQLVENVWIKGEWCDSLIYARLRREWAASPKLPS
jgi:RimJ/RimL family protein N-acetyltransferase